jgi:lipopolysaccharide/colanic/teichoic acid biosynthesis glycosyltransferase
MRGSSHKPVGRFAKWIFDRIAAVILIVLLSPLMALMVVWILIVDGRPVLFAQERAGRNGRAFPMLKFRTMVRNAVEVGRRLSLSEDPFAVIEHDPRITATGRVLRRTGLDELPQLFNILVGHMSLVGPRPDLMEQVANYSEDDRRRLVARPGFTGWAQVRGRDQIEWPERFRLDVWYIENWSWWLDIKILFLTAGQLFRSEAAPVRDTMNIERTRRRDHE